MASMLGNIAANTTVYNSTEVDSLLTAINNKLTSAMHYKGTKANLTAINAVTEKEIGDVYNAEDTGDNYAWNGTDWDKLAGVVDLSAYVLSESLGDLATQDTVTIAQVDGLTDALAACAKSADLGDLAELDEVAEANLATALATKINGKADTSSLGDLAFKDAAAIADVTGLQDALDACAKSADLGSLAELNEVSKANLAAALKTEIEGKANTADLGALAMKDTAAISEVTGLQDALDAKADADDVDAIAAKQAAVAGLTVPTKETVTLYALYDLVKGIVDAMKDAE